VAAKAAVGFGKKSSGAKAERSAIQAKVARVRAGVRVRVDRP